MKQDLAEVKSWLKSQKKHYSWLAEQCHVSEGAVKNWFSKGHIPTAKFLFIQRRMNEVSGRNPISGITIDFTDEEWEAISKILASSKQTFIQFVNQALANAAQEYFQNAIKEKVVSLKQFSPVDSLPAVATINNQSYSLNVIGNIAAGGLQAGDTVPYAIKSTRPLGKNEYILRVEGKSMEPIIMDGSLVVMRKHTIPPIPKVGTIVEYYDERGVTLKKLVRKKNPETGKLEYTLHPLNPEFGDIEPMDGGKISGVYVETLDKWEKA